MIFGKEVRFVIFVKIESTIESSLRLTQRIPWNPSIGCRDYGRLLTTIWLSKLCNWCILGSSLRYILIQTTITIPEVCNLTTTTYLRYPFATYKNYHLVNAWNNENVQGKLNRIFLEYNFLIDQNVSYVWLSFLSNLISAYNL